MCASYEAPGLDQFGSVQDGVAMPPSGVAPSSECDVAEAFAKYVAGPEALAGSGVLARHPWRSRSSAVGEQKRSGRFESPIFINDAADPAASFAAFAGSVHSLQATNAQMGVLTMPMFGSAETVTKKRRGTDEVVERMFFGGRLVSFVADTVYKFAPSNMVINMVTGLGDMAVGDMAQSIIIGVDRNSGKLTFVYNKNLGAISTYGGSQRMDSASEYRQQRKRMVDLQTGEILERELVVNTNGKEGVKKDIYRAVFPRDMIHDRRAFGHYKEVDGDEVGYFPLADETALLPIIGAMQLIHGEYGPSQIEGALFDSAGNGMRLFQHLFLPPSAVADRPLDVSIPRHIFSEMVIGRGRMSLPLFRIHPRTFNMDLPQNVEQFRAIDSALADTGYILVAQTMTGALVDVTPHARARITPNLLGSSSHAPTDAHLRMAEGDVNAPIIAMKADITGLDELISARNVSMQYLPGYVIKNAELDANGRALVVGVTELFTEAELDAIAERVYSGS